MRFYTKQHRFYCGIDLHARTMYVCIMDHEETILTHRNLPAATEALADVLQPYREDLVLAVECIFTWYRAAGLCSRIGVEFVLGHALYMKAINDGISFAAGRVWYRPVIAPVSSKTNRTWVTDARCRPVDQQYITSQG